MQQKEKGSHVCHKTVEPLRFQGLAPDRLAVYWRLHTPEVVTEVASIRCMCAKGCVLVLWGLCHGGIV
jgi:hypothetical protein